MLPEALQVIDNKRNYKAMLKRHCREPLSFTCRPLPNPRSHGDGVVQSKWQQPLPTLQQRRRNSCQP
jgi:hypothetical protein